jgi:hypothetical protein
MGVAREKDPPNTPATRPPGFSSSRRKKAGNPKAGWPPAPGSKPAGAIFAWLKIQETFHELNDRQGSGFS